MLAYRHTEFSRVTEPISWKPGERFRHRALNMRRHGGACLRNRNRGNGARNAEIRDKRMPALHRTVFGFDIAMDHATLMRILEEIRHAWIQHFGG